MEMEGFPPANPGKKKFFDIWKYSKRDGVFYAVSYTDGDAFDIDELVRVAENKLYWFNTPSPGQIRYRTFLFEIVSKDEFLFYDTTLSRDGIKLFTFKRVLKRVK